MRSVVVFLALLLTVPAGAHERPPTQTPPSQAPAHNPLECYCRAPGKMFAPRGKGCLRTAEGPRLAQCNMEINEMYWSITGAPSPQT